MVMDVAGLKIGDQVHVRVLDSGDVLVTPVKACNTPARQVEVVVRELTEAETGSGVLPIVSRWVRAAGAVTVAAVVTPFDFEGAVRNRRADAVVDRLQRESYLVMAFSNEKWINRVSGDDSFLDIWDAPDRHIATNLHSVVSRLCTPTSLAGSTYAPGRLSV